MKVKKDVKGYLEKYFHQDSEYYMTLADCSRSNRQTMVNSGIYVYNYDNIARYLMREHQVSSTADCIYVHDKYIDFIEFKGGINDTVDNECYQPIETECSECKKWHKEMFRFRQQYYKMNQKHLKDNLKLKAVDGLIFFINSILPQCGESDTEYDIRYICVYQPRDNPLEALENVMVNTIYESNPQRKISKSTANLLECLEHYGKEDANGRKPFYEKIFILTVDEFEYISVKEFEYIY